MIVTIAASTDSLTVARSLRDNPIAGVKIVPIRPAIEKRSFPGIPINVSFNINIDLSLTAVTFVVGWLVGRCKGAGGHTKLNINGKEISTDDPHLIEAELKKYDK